MLTGNAEQNPIGNQIRGTNLYYNSHTGYADWRDCTKCGLCIGRRRVCVRREGTHPYAGATPTRLLFIGEAPGATENATGLPFTGTAGRILNVLFDHVKAAFSYCLTNTVCCQPMDITDILDKDGKPVHFFSDDEAYSQIRFKNYSYSAINHNRQPSRKEIELCRPHINELLHSYSPKGIVYVGAIARDHYKTSLPSIYLLHPAAIARQEYKLLTIKKQARKLQKFIEGFNEIR